MDKNIWEIKNGWEFLSSISTFLAVVVALVFSSVQWKKKIKVTLSNSGRKADDFVVLINVINAGNVIVMVNSVYVEQYNKDIHEVNFNLNEKVLPVALKSGEVITMSSPYISHNLDKIKNIYIKDSTEKAWKCERRSIAFAKKIKSNYLGKAGLIYSKDSEVKENEIWR